LTFREKAFNSFRKMCRMNAKILDLIFDQIKTPSIKDMERDRLGNCDRDDIFFISGPYHKRPSVFLKVLRNDSLKKQILKFLIYFFYDDSFSNVIGEKTVRVAMDFLFYVLLLLEEES
jgi:hypothetical protein